MKQSKIKSNTPKHVVLNSNDLKPCWLTNGYTVWPINDPILAAMYRRKIFLPFKGWRVLIHEPQNYEESKTGCLKLK